MANCCDLRADPLLAPETPPRDLAAGHARRLRQAMPILGLAGWRSRQDARQGAA